MANRYAVEIVTGPKNTGAIIMARLIDTTTQAYLTPGVLASIKLTVTDLRTVQPVGIYSNLDLGSPAALVLAAPVVTPAWKDKDKIGYNFLHILPAAAIPNVSTYLAEYKFTFNNGGQPFVAQWQIETTVSYVS